MKKVLSDVTLIGADCVDIERLIQASEICQKDFEFGAVKLLTSKLSNHRDCIKIREISSVEDYSRFIIEELDSYIDTEFALIIQYDGFILNPKAWSDEFLKYDYIGAPWLVKNFFINHFGFPAHMLGQRIVGNGGFSMRSKKLTRLCAELAKANKFTKYHPEDTAICIRMREAFEKQGIKFAPLEVADKFSFEAKSSTNYKWCDQFGFHGLKWTDISKWLKNNPGYKIDNTLNTYKSFPSK